MIKITNKGRAVKLVEDEAITLGVTGKRLIQLNKELTIPAHTKVNFDTKLRLEITDLLDECIIGEYIEGEDSPLYVVCEPYDMNWDPEQPIDLSIYNSSDEDYTFHKGDNIAFIGTYHKCNCDETSEEFQIGAIGQQIVFGNDELKVIGNEDENYVLETVVEPDGTSYVKITQEQPAEEKEDTVE